MGLPPVSDRSTSMTTAHQILKSELPGTASRPAALLPPMTTARDYVLGVRMNWRLGYHSAFVAGRARSPHAFGHYGLGGSGAFADPETGLSVAFVTNRLGNTLTPLADLRLARLAAQAESIARRL